MTLHTYIPQPMPLPKINFLHIKVSEIQPRQEFKVKVTMAMSKVKTKSHHDVAHLQPKTNVRHHAWKFLNLMVSEIQPRQDIFYLCPLV